MADEHMHILNTAEDMALGAAWLTAHAPPFAHALSLTGPLVPRRKPDGFETLFSAIVSQQISVAAASSVWARLTAQGLTARAAVAQATDETLRAAGVSRQKARYAKALAASSVDFATLRDMSEADVMRVLTEVPGIGRWTAEIYLMFALGRADVFPHADMALQESARLLFDLPERPREREMRILTEEWRPWRAVAAQILWAYHKVEKSREGIS